MKVVNFFFFFFFFFFFPEGNNIINEKGRRDIFTYHPTSHGTGIPRNEVSNSSLID
jgi:hypothetical protein